MPVLRKSGHCTTCAAWNRHHKVLYRTVRRQTRRMRCVSHWKDETDGGKSVEQESTRHSRGRRRKVKLVKLDYGAEVRPLTKFDRRHGGQYHTVECPFCGRLNEIFHRNFCAGARCKNSDCKALLRLPTHDATRDMLPKSETILRHGLITRQGAQGKGWEEWKEAVEP